MDVMIADGALRGEERDGIRVFTGIPYAAPPVGELRFAPPQSVEPWTGVQEGAGQSSLQPDILGRGLSGSEDCLYLNVYTPAGPGPYPVMVWIHGGGGVAGSPNYYDRDAVRAARRRRGDGRLPPRRARPALPARGVRRRQLRPARPGRGAALGS